MVVFLYIVLIALKKIDFQYLAAVGFYFLALRGLCHFITGGVLEL